MPNDLYFQNINPVQNNQQPGPVTMAAAATIAPTTGITFLTGTTVVTTITPPVTGAHMLVLIFATGTANQLGTGGNIKTSATTVTNRAITLHYNPIDATYYVNAST